MHDLLLCRHASHKKLTNTSLTVSVQLIERKIYLIRGQKVMVDFDLAELYGVTTSRLNEQVTRNRKRFPEDFMFRLTKEESNSLRSHFAISKIGRGGRRHLPYVFTEQGVAMLSTVLNSEQAIEVNISIMRAFVQLRQILEQTKNSIASSLVLLGNSLHTTNILRSYLMN